jgi:hypothetical protein
MTGLNSPAAPGGDRPCGRARTFPLRHGGAIMSGEIKKDRKQIARAAGTSRRVELEQEPERPACDEGELSTTCKNSRLRQARNKAWDRARRITSYWRARLDWHSELRCAQDWELADSGSFPPLRKADFRSSKCGARRLRNSCLRPLLMSPLLHGNAQNLTGGVLAISRQA